MNKYILYLVLFSCVLLMFTGVPSSHTNSIGAPAGYSGSVSDNQNNCTSCHNPSNTTSNFSPQVLISSELQNGDDYTLGESYYISITAAATGISKFGFQACMENTQGEKVGSLMLSETTNTQLVGNGNYVTHTEFGTSGSGMSTWLFIWKAPEVSQGNLNLHTSVLFSNSNGSTSGDQVVYTTMALNAPQYGCTNSSAFNYSSANTIDDGTCLFNLSSDLIDLSFQSLNVAGPLEEELELAINVHNNTNEDLIVHVQRNISSPQTPLNWFCWGLCYAPTVSQSSYEVTVPAGSYVDDFSAHLLAQENPGTYSIEYCFYTEQSFEESICATVNFTVTGDVFGCTNPNALNFNSLANVDDASCIVFPEPNWVFAQTSAFIHSVAISSDASILINNSSIASGDWIGVFYEGPDGLICAGFTEWLGVNTNIYINGYDYESGEGFPSDQAFLWQVWDASNGVIWPMAAEYSSFQVDQNYFQNNGFSSLNSMVNLVPTNSQVLNIPEGWSLFSSYISTPNMSIDSFLAPIQDELVLVKNNSGASYIVEYDFNAIGDVLPGQAYLIKTNSSSEFTVEGEYLKPQLFPISLQKGWNMIGYLQTEPINADLVFQELVSQNLIQIVKDYQGNTLIPEWGFNGIGAMNPGEGYQLKTHEACILQY